MKPNNQVTSLSLSRRLRELKVPQVSLFYYAHQEELEYVEVYRQEWYDECQSEGMMEMEFTEYLKEVNGGDIYSAFTVAELGEMLKNFKNLRYYFNPLMGGSYWICVDQSKGPTDDYQFSKTEADCRAKMLIHLLESGLIDISSLAIENMIELTAEVLMRRIYGYIDRLESEPNAKADALFILKRIINVEEIVSHKRRWKKRKPTPSERYSKL